MIFSHRRHRALFYLYSLLFALSYQSTYASELSLSVGIQRHDAKTDTKNVAFDAQDQKDSGYSVSASYKNIYGKTSRHHFGAGIDIDEILGDRLLGYRALDYEYLLNNHLRLGAFFGAASLDSVFPQNGYYTGASISYLPKQKNLGLTLSWRHGNGLARDRIASDPSAERFGPDIFLDYNAIALQVRWQFDK